MADSLGRATSVARAGEWTGAPLDRVVLDYDGRFRRRVRLDTADGATLLLDLAEATELRDGDALKLEAGGLVAVAAAAEPLMELTARDALHLTRLAWHLGNRHLPTQIEADALIVRADHVIRDLAEKLGARIRDLEAPFTPEGGAYGQGRTHGHAHGPADGADHEHGRGHGHGHGHGHDGA